MTLTEGEYIMTMLGFGCFLICGLLIFAWAYDML